MVMDVIKSMAGARAIVRAWLSSGNRPETVAGFICNISASSDAGSGFGRFLVMAAFREALAGE